MALIEELVELPEMRSAFPRIMIWSLENGGASSICINACMDAKRKDENGYSFVLATVTCVYAAFVIA